MKHTPGPWGFGEYGKFTNIATVAHVGSIAIGPEFDNSHDVCYDNHGSDEDDARLISEAPALLSHLEGLIDILMLLSRDKNGSQMDRVESRHGSMVNVSTFIREARKAVNRATGEGEMNNELIREELGHIRRTLQIDEYQALDVYKKAEAAMLERDEARMVARQKQLSDAAPDLLAACIKTVEENGHLADGDNCTLIHLVKAIAKATGEQE